jgi:hypothetical protein
VAVVEGKDFAKKFGLCVSECFDHVSPVVAVEEELWDREIGSMAY